LILSPRGVLRVNHLGLGLALCLALFCAGCAGLGSGEAPLPPVGAVFARPDPRPLSSAQLSGLLAQTQVLLAGEIHDHPGHHQAQLDLLKAMTAAGDKPPVVGIEWLDHTQQAACDQLSAGRIGVTEFARLVDWENNWGFPLELYAPLLEFVAERRLRLVALNAPLEAVRGIGRGGLASLEPGLRAKLAPALDLGDEAYRARLMEQFRIHGTHGPALEENFFTAQVARDETMAERLAQALYPWPDGGGRAVVLAGGGHLSYGEGLPPRIARRLPGARLLTALAVPAQAAAALGEANPAGWPADLLVVSAPAPPPPPRLGVVLKPQEGGLLIERVLPASAADRAGLKPGDLLVAIDGFPLREIKQIHDLIKNAPLAPHEYRIKRANEEKAVTIVLGSPPR
jgi:uncharacterized iron-regulated protein